MKGYVTTSFRIQCAHPDCHRQYSDFAKTKEEFIQEQMRFSGIKPVNGRYYCKGHAEEITKQCETDSIKSLPATSVQDSSSSVDESNNAPQS